MLMSEARQTCTDNGGVIFTPDQPGKLEAMLSVFGFSLVSDVEMSFL